MNDVLVLGGAGVDTIVSVPELPLAYADSYMVPAIRTRAGQTGDGVALGLHALGVAVVHVDVLGDDPEGALVRELHERHGVPFVAVPTPAGTKRAVNLVDPQGRRLSLYDSSRGDDSIRFAAGDLPAATRHAHVSITDPCLHALPLLQDVSISTDLHNWDGENPYQLAFAKAADIVFMSATALQDPRETLRKVLSLGRPHTAIATDGADGAYLLTDDLDLHIPVAELPGAAVDSNGAGDAFVAGFLFGHLNGEAPATCARYGAVAGAHACTVPSTEVDPVDRERLLQRV